MGGLRGRPIWPASAGGTSRRIQTSRVPVPHSMYSAQGGQPPDMQDDRIGLDLSEFGGAGGWISCEKLSTGLMNGIAGAW